MVVPSVRVTDGESIRALLISAGKVYKFAFFFLEVRDDTRCDGLGVGMRNEVGVPNLKEV